MQLKGEKQVKIRNEDERAEINGEGSCSIEFQIYIVIYIDFTRSKINQKLIHMKRQLRQN